MKVCTKCGLEKEELEFHKRKDVKCGLSSHCKKCKQNYDKSLHGRTINNIATKKYRKSNKGQNFFHKYNRSDRAKELNKIRTAKYRNSEKGKNTRRQNKLMRRDMDNNLQIYLSTEDIKNIYIKFNNKCFNCGSDKYLQLDHHYPLSKGHALTLNNAVLLCRSCNASKGNKFPEEFYSSEKLQELSILV